MVKAIGQYVIVQVGGTVSFDDEKPTVGVIKSVGSEVPDEGLVVGDRVYFDSLCGYHLPNTSDTFAVSFDGIIGLIDDDLDDDGDDDDRDVYCPKVNPKDGIAPRIIGRAPRRRRRPGAPAPCLRSRET